MACIERSAAPGSGFTMGRIITNKIPIFINILQSIDEMMLYNGIAMYTSILQGYKSAKK